MTKRTLDGSRLYKLTKTIVLAATVIAIAVMLYTGFMSGFGTNILLGNWDKYCSLHPDNPEIVKMTGYTCIGTGLEEVYKFNSTCWMAFLIAILLPTSFFGGTALYKYLFPINKKVERLVK